MAISPQSLWRDRPDDWLTTTDADDSGHDTPSPPPARGSRGARRAALAALVAVAVAGSASGAYVVGARHGDDEPSAAPRAAGGRLAPSQIGAIYARASRGVVSVHVSSPTGTASGTGFVVDSDGTIVTNAHVVGDAQEAQVRFDDDAPVQAEVVGTDPSSDLAVLHVDPAQAGTLHPLTLAESDDVRVGDSAIAVGYPFGLDRTATAGIVSGLGRRIQAPNGVGVDEVIPADAPINPGNSGGPLLDASGRVIGVNSQIATASAGGGNVGVGFAIPSDTVREVVPRLKAGQTTP
jgi:putative serine protease PepD